MIPRGWSVSIGSLLVVLATCSAAAESARVVRHSPDPEIARIQEHLIGAEALLAKANVDRMPAPQRAARRVHMARLAAYRATGRFPHNHEVPGRRAPCFVDAHGTQCAMAYLIAESGRLDIVELVARTRNNATVTELAADEVIGPALAVWLGEAGLTVAEAQRIQPAYDDWAVKADPNKFVTGDFAFASGSLALVNLAMLGMNAGSALDGRASRWPAIVGFASGAANVGLGAANARYEAGRRTLGIIDIAVGSASIAASAWSMVASKPAPSLGIRIPGSDVVVRPSVAMDRRLGPRVSFGGSF